MDTELEKHVIRRISLRIVPFIMLLYFIAYIDRVNIGFAALTMKKDLGFSSSVFGFGAGIFFIGYFLFELPSNLVLEKVGARIWIARVIGHLGNHLSRHGFRPGTHKLLCHAVPAGWLRRPASFPALFST